MLLRRRYIYLCLVLQILRRLQVLRRNCTLVVEQLRAVQRLARKHFIGHSLLIVRHCSRQIGARNHQQRLPLRHGIAQLHLQIDDSPPAQRGNVDRPRHVWSHGPIRRKFGRQRSRFRLRRLKQFRIAPSEKTSGSTVTGALLAAAGVSFEQPSAAIKAARTTNVTSREATPIH